MAAMRPDPPLDTTGRDLSICTDGCGYGADDNRPTPHLLSWFGARSYTERQRKPRAQGPGLEVTKHLEGEL